MSNGGVSLIGIGESDNAENRALEAVERAINNPLLDVNIESAKGALVNIIGGPDMSLEEYRKVMQVVSSKVAPDAKIISGAKISADMEKNIKVLLIVTGVKSSQIIGSDDLAFSEKSDLEEELGIKFVNKMWQYEWYKKFYNWHCYYWWIFIISVILHATLALYAYGIPN